MRSVLVLLFVLTFSITSFAQEKPLTQTEFVKMLYGLQTDPRSKTEIIDALRRRGISFPLTDGIRGLTRSKGGNDEELKRSLRGSGASSKRPGGFKASADRRGFRVHRKKRERRLSRLSRRCRTSSSSNSSRARKAYAGTGNLRPYDNLVIAVSYSEEKGEQYRVLMKKGVPVQDSVAANSYSGLDGATSGGEFVEDLQKIFRPESKTHFEIVTTDLIRGRRTFVYDYVINIENNKHGGVGLKGPAPQSSPSGEKGRIWIDRETAQVLRIDYQLTDIAPTFPVKSVTKSIDYDMVEIAGARYLLPVVSDFRGVVQGGSQRFEQRNLIRFRNYQKYGTEVTIVEEDTAPVSEEKPNQ
jgi:hypothetical protein